MTRCGNGSKCSCVKVTRDGVVCCGKLRPFPNAFCVHCGCTWGSGALFVRRAS